jgi:hypothetical protein
MPQIFPKRSNVIARVTLFGGILLVAGGAWAADEVYRSSIVTNRDVEVEQPVPFSHQHHVQGLGLDCRYCHQGVERSAMAGMPPTETCMTCHSQLYADAPVLAPVRQSQATGVPIAWQRVTRLPDYVYFNHAAHVSRGVSCETCHGRVDEMPLTRKVHAFHMQFCLDCHQHPQDHLRAQADVFRMGGPAASPVPALAAELDPHRLTNCSTCHR